MPNDEDLKRVERATVTLTKKGGKGVLVFGDYILTAAHCIKYSIEGWMILGVYYIENLSTSNGEIIASPVAVEPVSDIAVIGPPDNQGFPEEWYKYNDFCEAVKPIPICFDDLNVNQPFKVYIYTHVGKWIEGSAELVVPDSESLWIEYDEQIEFGTSGSPIINEAGELVGIVTSAPDKTDHSKPNGRAPRPHLTIPLWIYKRIIEAQE